MAEASERADLRLWLAAMRSAGEIRDVAGAGWDLEIGAISEYNYRQQGHRALLFGDIRGCSGGGRLLTGSVSAARRLGFTFRLGADVDDAGLVAALRGKPAAWEAAAAAHPPRVVVDGPVLEGGQEGAAVDLSPLPAPRWHEQDGGRYLGTGTAVVTRHPETGAVNVGAYRMMVLDERRLTLQIVPGKHGRMNYEAWWRRGERCPVAVSLGHDPLLYCLAGTELPATVSEFAYYGAVCGQPLEVVRGELTGLPFPAGSEVVLEGFIDPDHLAPEGPFGEWTGYYSYSEREVPVLAVERVWQRPDPIVLGVPPGLPPHDFSYFRTVFKSASIQDALVQTGLAEVRGVWCHEAGAGRLLVVVAIRQRYCGHARQVGHLASQLPVAAYMGRYVIVVDDDIDPSDLRQVMWAVCTRSDPAEDIDVIRRAWGSPADPLCDDPGRPYNTRAVIDACIPYDRRSTFPAVARMSAELERHVAVDWGHLWAP